MEQKMLIAKKDSFSGKYGYIEFKKDDWIINPQYDMAMDFYNNEFAAVKIKDKWGIIDSKSRWIIYPEFEDIYDEQDNAIPVKKDNKWGILILQNNKLDKTIPFIYEDIEVYKDNIYEVKLKAKYGLIHVPDGNYIAEPIYDRIYWHNNADCIPFKINNMYGILDDKGNYILTPQRNKIIVTSKTPLKIKKDELYGLINPNGEIIISTIYEEIIDIKRLPYYGVKKDNKWGFLDLSGKIIVEPKYDYISEMNEGEIIHNGKRGGFILNNGTLVEPDYDECIHHYPYIFIKKNDKWGCIHRMNSYVTDIVYDEYVLDYIFPYPGRPLQLKKFNQWGRLNSEGIWIKNPDGKLI